MHASSFENMVTCFERYVRGASQFDASNLVVLDVGGADVNGGYRSIFSENKFQYLTADISDEEGVDVVLEDPYRLPFDDRSVDIVVSGQMLEHCEFFWMTFAEMMRVLKPSGYLFLIAPSAGPIHRYPVDCYRFYPDAYRALAKFANCRLVDVWLDERGPWRDLVGVFTKHKVPVRDPISTLQPVAAFDPILSPPGSPEEERLSGERPYLEVMQAIHESFRPELYVEIGVRHGRSLSLASGRAVGIDPAPDIQVPLSSRTEVLTTTSDRFFSGDPHGHLKAAPDLAFIDGMHLFEYALRDFMNIERLGNPDTLIVIDDIFPNHPVQADRTRKTRAWMGDVWKLMSLLVEVRPDLFILPVNTYPSGLLIIAGIDPANRMLWDKYNPLVRHFRAIDGVPEDILLRQGALVPGDLDVGARIDTLAHGKSVSPHILEKLKMVLG